MKWRDPTASMWDEALQLLERADRLHRQFFQPSPHAGQCPTWAPPVDIVETQCNLVIIAALPGVAAEQLSVSIDADGVFIRGQRAMPAGGDTAVIRRLEIPFGRFERRIELPAGQFRLGQRLLKDGCLILTLDKLG